MMYEQRRYTDLFFPEMLVRNDKLPKNGLNLENLRKKRRQKCQFAAFRCALAGAKPNLDPNYPQNGPSCNGRGKGVYNRLLDYKSIINHTGA